MTPTAILTDDALDVAILRALDPIAEEGISVPAMNTAQLFRDIRNSGGLMRMLLACEQLQQRGLIYWDAMSWKLTATGRLEVRKEGVTRSDPISS